MRTIRRATVMGVLALLGSAELAVAQACKPEQLFSIIDRTGQRLREINAEGQPRLRAKLVELGARNGWSEAELESRGRAVIEDDVTRGHDARAAQLLTELDQLSNFERQADDACKRIEEAQAKSAQLIEISQERSSHALARIDLALRPQPAPAPQAVATAAPQTVPTQTQSSAALNPPRAKSPPPGAWDTRTVRDAESAPPLPAAAPPLPPPADAAALGYSPEEIRAAGRGFFGSISAGLASVIDHAFQRYGRPTGYILGDEGGGAFFAGLRYGQGSLVTKSQGERRVYWQGPSAGFDFGLAGSQVMFLVYNIDDHEELFQRFSGVDGSAYLVGGVGVTFLRRGKVTLAPIRTGLGLRVGANVGYLKFTPRQSLNPF